MTSLGLFTRVAVAAAISALFAGTSFAEGGGLAEQFATKRLKKGVTVTSGRDAARRRSLFSLFGGLDQGKEIRVVSRKARKKRFNNPSPEVSQPERLAGALPGYGKLVYQPDKLETLRAAKFETPAPFESMPAAIYADLVSKEQTVRATTENRKAILAAYEANGFKPLWVSADGLGPRGQAVLKLLAGSAADGLDPEEYLPSMLGSFADDPAIHRNDLPHLARLDLGLTAAAMAYARHASGGKLIPNRLTSYNDIAPPAADPADAMRMLQFSPFPDAYLAGLQPKHPAYGVLKATLADLRDGWDQANAEPIPSGKRIKPGQRDARVALARLRLERMRLYAPEAPPINPAAAPAFGGEGGRFEPSAAADPEVLDERLALSLKAFQKKSNLKQTGAIDTLTTRALNNHGDKRDLMRLVVNMDRLRWLPKDLGERHVFVNQAAFALELKDKGAIVWSTKVVVGRPDTQTVAFHDEMETVVFNPTWGVPPSIIAGEMLPILRRDPSYLDRKGFQVVNSRGKRVRSSSVRWSSYGDKVPFSVIQPSGGGNALGEVKFLFPNSHDIYMHDTPSRSLFQRPVRAFSHGCVRVENPRRFAEVVAGLSTDQVAKEISAGKLKTVRLPQKLPVHIAYFTAWPAADGTIAYFDDVYGRDIQMEKVLTTKTVAQR